MNSDSPSLEAVSRAAPYDPPRTGSLFSRLIKHLFILFMSVLYALYPQIFWYGLQMAVSSMWVLGIKPSSSRRAASTIQPCVFIVKNCILCIVIQIVCQITLQYD